MEQFEKDLEVLGIDKANTASLTIKIVTSHYKKKAKLKHPDTAKDGSSNESFQELQSAYRRVIETLDTHENKETGEHDLETEFFMKNNLVKECFSSFVIYVEEHLIQGWKYVFDKNLKTHDVSEIRTIYKTGYITVTLYLKPKRDPRSKVHIQGRDQNENMEFIVEKLASFYREVRHLAVKELPAPVRMFDKATCGQCGKQFVNKGGLKRHVIRMHSVKSVSTSEQ